MGEITENCPFGDCQYCQKDQRKFDELIKLLSEMHNKGTRDPESLCRAERFKNFNQKSGLFEEIPKMQVELFRLAFDNLLPWARNYVYL